jgi:hypothetical protein
MGILGLWTIRRRFFELFYYAHHITCAYSNRCFPYLSMLIVLVFWCFF